MELDKAKLKRRHAVAGVLAALFLFAMLFTVGTSYFLFVNNNNLSYSKASAARATAIQSRLNEYALLTASAPAPSYKISFTINNQGGVAVNVTAVYVTNSTGYVLAFYKKGSTGITPSLPTSVNIGVLSGTIATGVPYTSGANYIIRAVTERGSVFTTTYPPTATTLAAQALSSGAIGDLYLSFRSYTFYTVVTTSCAASGTPVPGGVSSGYCLSNQGLAFAISQALYTGSTAIAFSVTVTDFNPQQANIVLDPYTLMSLVPEKGAGTLKYIDWYVVSNSSSVILNAYTPLTLYYNKPYTIVFASGLPLATGVLFSSTTLQSTGVIASGTTTPAFLVSHGCEGVGQTTCLVASSNYGQNSPYVTSLFY